MKNMKKFICGLLSILIIFTMLPNLGVASRYDDRYDDRYYRDRDLRSKPSLSIRSQDIPSIDPGNSKTINFRVENSGDNTAENIIMRPIFEDSSPLSSNTLSSSISLRNIGRNSSENVSLDIKADSKAKPGNYRVALEFKYNYISETRDPVTSDRTDQLIEETQTLDLYVRVTDNTTQAQIIIKEILINPEEIFPGDNARLDILFENKGSIDADNVKVRLEGLDKDGGFYIGTGSDLGYIKKVAGGLVSAIGFDLKAAKNIKSGTQELEVVFSYDDEESRQKIYLTAKERAEPEAELIIENLKYPTGAISPNRDFTLTFDLKNNSELKASNIVVNAESTDIASVVPKSIGIRKITSMEPDESESFTFVFTPTDDSTTRSYPIRISVSYEDEENQGEENRIEVEQYVGIYAFNPDDDDDDDDKKSTPKLIIDKYSFSPKLVRAGEEFSMDLSFYNTNSIRSVRNIKIFLTSDDMVDSSPGSSGGGGSVFTPVGTSNTFYIDSIPPKGRVQKRVTMFTVPDAKAKTYTMTANFEYEDSEADEYTATELIGVPVVQQSQLDVGELEYSPEAFIGESTPISLEFYNTGKSSLDNLMVKIEGNFQTENGQFYVGNFESGGSEFFEGYVIPNEPGPLVGEVVFTFEDSTGEAQEIRREFNLNVIDMPPMEEFPEDGMDDGSGGIMGILKSPLFWIAIIAAAVITGVFIKRRKNKKDEEFDLDE